ncbi:hypothetical protein NNRS527_00173 [Nitrosospira sp. NRS527]|nr:hypothetical protein NNRS527_00173 [Nitrosospira sp. NRS527]
MIATDRRGTLMHCTRAACTGTGDLSGVASRGFRLGATVMYWNFRRHYRGLAALAGYGMVLLILLTLPLAQSKTISDREQVNICRSIPGSRSAKWCELLFKIS